MSFNEGRRTQSAKGKEKATDQELSDSERTAPRWTTASSLLRQARTEMQPERPNILRSPRSSARDNSVPRQLPELSERESSHAVREERSRLADGSTRVRIRCEESLGESDNDGKGRKRERGDGDTGDRKDSKRPSHSWRLDLKGVDDIITSERQLRAALHDPSVIVATRFVDTWSNDPYLIWPNGYGEDDIGIDASSEGSDDDTLGSSDEEYQ